MNVAVFLLWPRPLHGASAAIVVRLWSGPDLFAGGSFLDILTLLLCSSPAILSGLCQPLVCRLLGGI